MKNKKLSNLNLDSLVEENSINLSKFMKSPRINHNVTADLS